MTDATRKAFRAALKKETHPGVREFLREMLKDATPPGAKPRRRRRPSPSKSKGGA